MDPFSITFSVLGTGLCAISTFLIALCLYTVRTLPFSQRLLARHLGGLRAPVTSAALLCLGWLLLLFTNLSLHLALPMLLLGLALFVAALLILQRPDPSTFQASPFSHRILPALIALSLALSPFVIFLRIHQNLSSIKWGPVR